MNDDQHKTLVRKINEEIKSIHTLRCEQSELTLQKMTVNDRLAHVNDNLAHRQELLDELLRELRDLSYEPNPDSATPSEKMEQFFAGLRGESSPALETGHARIAPGMPGSERATTG